MYISTAVIISAIMGYGSAHHFGIESLFITLPVSLIIGAIGGFLQARM